MACVFFQSSVIAGKNVTEILRNGERNVNECCASLQAENCTTEVKNVTVNTLLHTIHNILPHYKKQPIYVPFVGFFTVCKDFNNYFALGWNNPLQHIHRHPAGEHLLSNSENDKLQL